MADDTISRAFRMTSDLDQRVEEYMEREDVTSRSEALRHLIKQGLDSESAAGDPDRPPGTIAGLLWDARHDIHLFILIMLAGVVGAELTGGVVAAVLLAVSFAYALTVVVAAVDAVILDSRILRYTASYSADETAEVEA